MKRHLIAAALLLAGCAPDAPPPTGAQRAAFGPIPAGTEYMVVNPKYPQNTVVMTTGDGVAILEPGTLVRIVKDPGIKTGQEVVVSVLSGKDRDRAGTIPHAALMPKSAR